MRDSCTEQACSCYFSILQVSALASLEVDTIIMLSMSRCYHLSLLRGTRDPCTCMGIKYDMHVCVATRSRRKYAAPTSIVHLNIFLQGVGLLSTLFLDCVAL